MTVISKLINNLRITYSQFDGIYKVIDLDNKTIAEFATLPKALDYCISAKWTSK
jgi:hypothetical protein